MERHELRSEAWQSFEPAVGETLLELDVLIDHVAKIGESLLQNLKRAARILAVDGCR